MSIQNIINARKRGQRGIALPQLAWNGEKYNYNRSIALANKNTRCVHAYNYISFKDLKQRIVYNLQEAFSDSHGVGKLELEKMQPG